MLLMLQVRIMMFAGVIFTIYLVSPSEACNEAICASIVSKCMLLKSCKCELNTCSCCKDCFLCLSFLYDECCSCFDLCPKPNITSNPLSKKSHVEDFDEAFPELFQALTDEPDVHKRWSSFTYPVDLPIKIFNHYQDKNFKYTMQSIDGRYNYSTRFDVTTVNCTVAFIVECNSWDKCKKYCQSMGATSYRWFHDGCCECIGDTCINYGVNESRCLNCPVKMKKIVEDEYDDYGQDEDYEVTDD
ncbi:PREDICTED: twisted gastrulation protein homolog 1-A-like [Ceratosolen solmsi marchali]|uniref:Twisted gastrulation protein homolog 1-A-like n=1 Tax=Ceratosolen solmsi marchali TaxID=326594 RepID=A0AAJ6VKS9_9HYME|nr:PREDICTED: twisted gastrulation protein homolog 1-A-like [Ceratosolen solmsi marchali]